jgi:hypothetical protein
MWQITWMISVLPDWFWTLLLFAGVGALGASTFLRLYTMPLKVGGIAAVMISLWFLGAASNEEKWQEHVQELEAKVAAAETKSTEANTVIEEKIITKTKVIKEKGDQIIQFIDRDVIKSEEVIKYVERCPGIPKEIIDAHNAAAIMNQAAEGKK